nr:hypothetical protein [Streptomyces sp. ISL-24]
MIADRDPVQDDHVRADPHVIADRDAFAGQWLAVYWPIGGEAVIEAQEGTVCSDAHAVAEHDTPPDRGIRVHRAVGSGGQFAGHIGMPGDIAVRAHPQGVREDACRRGDEALRAEIRALVGQTLLAAGLRHALLGGGMAFEVPGAVVEVGVVEGSF